MDRDAEGFYKWLTPKVNNYKLTDYYLAFETVDEYCNKKHIINRPLLQVVDLLEITRVRERVMKERSFSVELHELGLTLTMAREVINFYREYRHERVYVEAQTDIRIAYQSKANARLEFEDKDEIRAKSVKSIGRTMSYNKVINSTSSTVKLVEFNKQQQFSFTKPIGFSYFNKSQAVKSWKQLYVDFVKMVYADYPRKIYQINGIRLSGAPRFARIPEVFTAPKCIKKRVYLETNYSSNDIIKNLKWLLDYCEIDYKDVVIKYFIKNKNYDDTPIIENNDNAIEDIEINSPPVENKTNKLNIDFTERDEDGWDVYETAQLLSLYSLMDDIKDSDRDNSVIILASKLHDYHQKKYPDCSDDELAEFSLYSLAKRVYCLKKYFSDETSEDSGCNGLTLKIIDIRKDQPQLFAKLLDLNEYEKKSTVEVVKESLPIATVIDAWDKYQVVKLIDVMQQLKTETKLWPIYKLLSEKLTAYRKANHIDNVESCTIAQLTKRLLRLSTYINDNSSQNPDITDLEKSMLDMYRTDQVAYNQLLLEANEKLGYTVSVVEPEPTVIEPDNENIVDQSNAAPETVEKINDRTDDDTQPKDSNDVAANCQALMLELFPKGISLQRKLQVNKFLLRYKERYGRDITKSQLKAILPQIAVERDGVFIAKNTTGQKQLLQNILETIKTILKDGYTCVYKSCLYQKFSSQIADELAIYDEKQFLEQFSDYVNKKLYESKEYYYGTYSSPDFVVDVSKYFENELCERSYDEIQEDLWFLPLVKIKQGIRDNNTIINTSPSHYINIQAFPLNTEQLPAIKNIIAEGIKEANNGHLNIEDCRQLLYSKLPELKIDTEDVSITCFRNALSYWLKGDFKFSAKFIVSNDSEKINLTDVFKDFCQNNDYFTYDDLEELAKENNYKLVWILVDEVRKYSIRLNDYEFCNLTKINFPVAQIDEALENFCPNDFIALKDIKLFSLLPSLEEYPWNEFLLESYLWLYSEKFYILHSNFSKNKASGAMVRVDSSIQDYDEILIRALSDNYEWETTDDALQYLMNNNYLSRKSKDIEKIISEANKLRKLKDRNG